MLSFFNINHQMPVYSFRKLNKDHWHNLLGSIIYFMFCVILLGVPLFYYSWYDGMEAFMHFIVDYKLDNINLIQSTLTEIFKDVDSTNPENIRKKKDIIKDVSEYINQNIGFRIIVTKHKYGKDVMIEKNAIPKVIRKLLY